MVMPLPMLKETGPLLRLPLPKKLMGWPQLVTETGVLKGFAVPVP